MMRIALYALGICGVLVSMVEAKGSTARLFLGVRYDVRNKPNSGNGYAQIYALYSDLGAKRKPNCIFNIIDFREESWKGNTQYKVSSSGSWANEEQLECSLSENPKVLEVADRTPGNLCKYTFGLNIDGQIEKFSGNCIRTNVRGDDQEVVDYRPLEAADGWGRLKPVQMNVVFDAIPAK